MVIWFTNTLTDVCKMTCNDTLLVYYIDQLNAIKLYFTYIENNIVYNEVGNKLKQFDVVLSPVPQ